MPEDYPGAAWLGRPVDPYGDPWYRFGRVIAMVEKHASISKGAKWLDVGCQIGQFLKLLRSRHPIVPTGIDDFDETNVVEACRKHLSIEIRNASEVLDDSWRYLSRQIDKVGFGIDETFQFISALEVLEHMVDTDAFLRECNSHLEAGGHLIISTPNINSLRNRVQVPLGIYPAGMEYRTINHHVRLYNARVLESHLEEHGFRLVAMAGVNSLRARHLRYALVRRIDAWLADRLPSLCGCMIAIFRKVAPTTSG